MAALSWIEDSAASVWIRESDWGYPIVLTSHAIAMAIVVGTALMFNLRLLGYGRQLPVVWLERLFGLAWCGFLLNAVSGVLLFGASPQKFLSTTAFQIKLLLILAGGISLWLATRLLHAERDAKPLEEVSRKVSIVASFSLAFWTGAIVAGRLIAYMAHQI